MLGDVWGVGGSDSPVYSVILIDRRGNDIHITMSSSLSSRIVIHDIEV